MKTSMTQLLHCTRNVTTSNDQTIVQTLKKISQNDRDTYYSELLKAAWSCELGGGAVVMVAWWLMEHVA